MPTITTLKKRADFLRLNRGGKAITPLLILRYAKNDGTACRVGYTVTTKCGNAVVRNRIKRRLRALTRELMPLHGKDGFDYVFIARADVSPNAAKTNIADLRASMSDALARAANA
jgi:ribonuclease P protein component